MGSPEGALKEENKAEHGWLQQRARDLLLIAVLGAGGQVLRDSSERSQKFNETKPFNEDTLENLFELEWAFPSKSQNYVGFLPQVHGLSTLKMMESNQSIKEVIIESQKHCARALLDMKADEVYWEGITLKWEKWFMEYSTAGDNFRNALKLKQFKESGQWLDTRMREFEIAVREGKFPDERVRANVELFHFYLLEELFHAIHEEKTVLDSALLKTLSDARQALHASPKFIGENKYLWGAPAVLWAQGLVRIRATEDPKLLNFAGILSLQMIQKKKTGTLTQQDIDACITIHNQREDFALQLTLRDKTSANGERRVIQFGSGHDFYKNFQQMYENGETRSFGLVQLTDSQQLKFDTIIHKNSDPIETSFAINFLKDAR